MTDHTADHSDHTADHSDQSVLSDWSEGTLLLKRHINSMAEHGKMYDALTEMEQFYLTLKYDLK